PTGVAGRAVIQAMSVPKRPFDLWAAMKPALAVAGCAAVLVAVWKVSAGRQAPQVKHDSVAIAGIRHSDDRRTVTDKGSKPSFGIVPELRNQAFANNSPSGANRAPNRGSGKPSGPGVGDMAYLNGSNSGSAAEWARLQRAGKKGDTIPTKFRPIGD